MRDLTSECIERGVIADEDSGDKVIHLTSQEYFMLTASMHDSLLCGDWTPKDNRVAWEALRDALIENQ